MAGFLSFLRFIFKPRKFPKDTPKSMRAVLELRELLFAYDPTSLGIRRSESGPVWALIMETGSSGAVVTLVTIADGTVSMYFSSGGGIIGAGSHESVRSASDALLAFAPSFLPYAQRAKDFPMPSDGNTRFYFLTFNGIFAAEADTNELGGLRAPLSPLFYKAQAVITEMRLAYTGGQEGEGRIDGTVANLQLITFSTNGVEAAVEELLEAGADPSCADKTGLTPLISASYMGHEGILRVLLAAGSAVDAKDSSGYTALMYACKAGHTQCAQLLLDHGADPNSRDKDDSTPIMFCAQHGHNDVVRLLLARGADPDFKGAHGLSAVGFAKQNKLPETLRILTQGK